MIKEQLGTEIKEHHETVVGSANEAVLQRIYGNIAR